MYHRYLAIFLLSSLLALPCSAFRYRFAGSTWVAKSFDWSDGNGIISAHPEVESPSSIRSPALFLLRHTKLCMLEYLKGNLVTYSTDSGTVPFESLSNAPYDLSLRRAAYYSQAYTQAPQSADLLSYGSKPGHP